MKVEEGSDKISKHLAQLDMSAWAFKGGFYTYAINTEFLCMGSNISILHAG